jgi:hypothetical protein
MTEPSSEQEEPKKPAQAESKEAPEGKLFALIDELPSPFGQDVGVTEGSWFYDNDR